MRLDPLSIPYRAVEKSFQFVVGAAFIGFAGFGSNNPGSLGSIVGILAVVLLGLVVGVGWQVAYFKRFEYRLTGDTFDIDSGVVSRREREIPYGRIQNVDISQNVIQRALGIAEVRLETAGGGETEAKLRFVSYDEAERLQEEVAKRKRDETGDGETAPVEERTTALFDITPRELVVLGIVSMDPRLLSIIAVPLSFVGPSVYVQFIPETGSVWLLVGSSLVGIVVVTALLSGVIAMTRYYGFQLRATDDEYRYERGLLQRFSGSIPKSKVQTLTLTENVIARRLGYASLTIETAGYAATGGADSNGSQSAIPIADRDHALSVARRIEPFESLEFQRPPKRARQRYAARYLIVVGVLLAISYAVVALTSVSYPWFAPAALVVLVPPAAHLKWANRGYRIEDDHVLTRNGFWSRRISVVPSYRIQTVVTSATVFQRPAVAGD
ncbi:PH domain-containing protein, partial [Halapricum sp. CBA1109]|uniref:PH domain-containing protein n=1 Tax=Halapricum sp. CBA1109 TaxID=2668068 RepID=UPI0012FC106D